LRKEEEDDEDESTQPNGCN